MLQRATLRKLELINAAKDTEDLRVQKMSNSSITTESDLIKPLHPGEIRMEDFIECRALRDKIAAITPLKVS